MLARSPPLSAFHLLQPVANVGREFEAQFDKLDAPPRHARGDQGPRARKAARCAMSPALGRGVHPRKPFSHGGPAVIFAVDDEVLETVRPEIERIVAELGKKSRMRSSAPATSRTQTPTLTSGLARLRPSARASRCCASPTRNRCLSRTTQRARSTGMAKRFGRKGRWRYPRRRWGSSGSCGSCTMARCGIAPVTGGFAEAAARQGTVTRAARRGR